jgi:hypothetical protein
MAKKNKITIKHILTSNGNWWNFYKKHAAVMRAAIVICVLKLLSCRTVVRGYNQYHCSDHGCSHVKRVFHTCKSRACSSCGKKATEAWIQKQNAALPATSWQHITFTMPSELWDFFWCSRQLLSQIGRIAADCVKNIADKKSLTLGIFIAIHTFGRDLKRNVHIHLSVTCGGISHGGTEWKDIFFHQTTLMKMWRYKIIQLFRKAAPDLVLPPGIKKQLSHIFTFNKFLDLLYKKKWIVHCSRPSADHKQNVGYLGRYLKRPAVAESKLRHYDGSEVTFKYLDHKTKIYRSSKLTAEEFIGKFVSHIPDTGFRMIRYYGFLANRVRGVLLPLVRRLLGENDISGLLPPTTYAELIQKNFGFNPLICVLCGAPLLLAAVQFGKSKIADLLPLHRDLALLKIC